MHNKSWWNWMDNVNHRRSSLTSTYLQLMNWGTCLTVEIEKSNERSGPPFGQQCSERDIWFPSVWKFNCPCNIFIFYFVFPSQFGFFLTKYSCEWKVFPFNGRKFRKSYFAILIENYVCFFNIRLLSRLVVMSLFLISCKNIPSNHGVPISLVTWPNFTSVDL